MSASTNCQQEKNNQLLITQRLARRREMNRLRQMRFRQRIYSDIRRHEQHKRNDRFRKHLKRVSNMTITAFKFLSDSGKSAYSKFKNLKLRQRFIEMLNKYIFLARQLGRKLTGATNQYFKKRFDSGDPSVYAELQGLLAATEYEKEKKEAFTQTIARREESYQAQLLEIEAAKHAAKMEAAAGIRPNFREICANINKGVLYA